MKLFKHLAAIAILSGTIAVGIGWGIVALVNNPEYAGAMAIMIWALLFAWACVYASDKF